MKGSNILNFTQFKNGIASGEEFSVYLLEGEDAYFRERGLALIKETFLTEPSINTAVFTSDNLNYDEFISSIYSYPLMSKKRVTVIREFYPKVEAITGEFKNFLENPPSEDVLVIVNEKSHDIFKKYKSVCFVDCSKADPAVIARWIKAKLLSNNIEIDFETAGILRDYCLSDMTRIENETEKLISYLKSGTVTKEIIDNTVTRSTEYKIYEMTDYLGKKRVDMALSVIKDMLGKGETPTLILSSIYNYFRRLLHTAISGKSTDELAKFFGVKEYAVTKLIAQSKMFKKKELKRAVDYLVDADYKIKSGRVNDFEEMWLVVFKILTA